MEYEQVEVNSQRWLDLEDLTNEEWRDVVGYEGLYKVSNYGRVRSLGRWTIIQTYERIYRPPRILRSSFNGNYYRVVVSVNGKSSQKLVHRMVAEAFVPNPESKNEVNHINENMLDNRADNLNWLTKQENRIWGTAVERQRASMSASIGRPVCQYALDGKLIAKYRDSHDAARRMGCAFSNIYDCCKGGKQKSALGYIWCFDGVPFKPVEYKFRKKIFKYDESWNLIRRYESVKEVSIVEGTAIEKFIWYHCRHKKLDYTPIRNGFYYSYIQIGG